MVTRNHHLTNGYESSSPFELFFPPQNIIDASHWNKLQLRNQTFHNYTHLVVWLTINHYIAALNKNKNDNRSFQIR